MTYSKIFGKLIIDMKVIFKYFFIFIIIIQMFFLKSFSYEEFNGKYSYNEYNSNNNYNIDVFNENKEVLFIVDFSNSMNQKMGFSPKAYLAIDALRAILNDSGQKKKIGLRIFGVTDKPIIQRSGNGYSWIKENLCTASSLVMPIARYNAENISDKLSQLNPQGVTPIGYSLRQAVQNDFSPSATLKHIILITDGGENCGDDPCLFIRRLMQLRDDFKIDVIGITVDINAYSQLKCIALAGKGEYYNVRTPEDFKIKFKQAFDSKTKLSVSPQPIKVEKTEKRQDDGIKYKNFVYEFYD